MPVNYIDSNINKSEFSFIIKERTRIKKLSKRFTDPCKQRVFAEKYIEELIYLYKDHQRENKFISQLRTLPLDWAFYVLSNFYATLLPHKYRSDNGIYYTPPPLVNRLIDSISSTNFNWSQARIIDPACGGGAFIVQVIQKVVSETHFTDAVSLEEHLKEHIKGYDIDPFGIWLTTEFLNILLAKWFPDYHFDLTSVIVTGDSLALSPFHFSRYDLVIGNPPYGKIKLSDRERAKWKESIYGHVNNYGLFTHMGTIFLKKQGILAFVMPASFLGGLYFKNLRNFLLRKCPPIAADFISDRSGIFPDVLQEVSLMYFQKEACPRPRITVNFIEAHEFNKLSVTPGGIHLISSMNSSPWIIPRKIDQLPALLSLSCLPNTLADFGYKVSTGPFVWNRHKIRLRKRDSGNVVPIIWSECLHLSYNGKFKYQCKGRNHLPFYKPKKNDPNIISDACILMQRTTALEQKRRLVCAILPQSFLDMYPNGVVIENHLNMIIPIKGTTPSVSMSTINFLLNSSYIDLIFRSINGSVAVSAYEVESLPLPKLCDLLELEELLNEGKVEKAESLMNNLFIS
jgi:adenine-specific DNA-methyltransferase